MAHDFVQNDPGEGEPATFDTEVRVLYDDDALYFGVFAKDDEPGRLIVSDIKKDYNTGTSDGFTIILDTFHDERNGYQFATNPAGAKWDSQTSNEGRENNANWDGIWDVATKVTETGLACGNSHSVPHAEVHRGRHPDVGRELRTQAPPFERRQLLGTVGSHFNRIAGMDANFRFGFLTLNGYLARSLSPESATPERGNAYASRFWRTNEAARISFNTRYAVGTFYDGYRRNLNFGPAMRLNENFNASVNLQLNDIELSTGAFVSKLVTARVNYNFNTKMFFNALVQYNSDNHQWTSNLRFNIIHRPLSDFFLVYNERRDERTGQMISRAVIGKMTYMLAF